MSSIVGARQNLLEEQTWYKYPKGYGWKNVHVFCAYPSHCCTNPWLILQQVYRKDALWQAKYEPLTCVHRIAEWTNLLTSSNCSHSECVHSIWCQAWNNLYEAISCYSTTTAWGVILHKVVGDGSTATEALNLTPGENYSGRVHWSDHLELWSPCNVIQTPRCEIKPPEGAIDIRKYRDS